MNCCQKPVFMHWRVELFEKKEILGFPVLASLHDLRFLRERESFSVVWKAWLRDQWDLIKKRDPEKRGNQAFFKKTWPKKLKTRGNEDRVSLLDSNKSNYFWAEVLVWVYCPFIVLERCNLWHSFSISFAVVSMEMTIESRWDDKQRLQTVKWMYASCYVRVRVRREQELSHATHKKALYVIVIWMHHHRT